jgi:hypothetical protein
MTPGDGVGFAILEVPISREELTWFVDHAADEEPDKEPDKEADEEPDEEPEGKQEDVEDVKDVDVCESIAVVLLAKIDAEKSQSSGMLLPSSSSKASGARVHARPGVSLSRVLLFVADTVFVSM